MNIVSEHRRVFTIFKFLHQSWTHICFRTSKTLSMWELISSYFRQYFICFWQGNHEETRDYGSFMATFHHLHFPNIFGSFGAKGTQRQAKHVLRQFWSFRSWATFKDLPMRKFWSSLYPWKARRVKNYLG